MTPKEQIVEIICADRWIQTDREQAAEKADKILALTGHELIEALAETAAALEKAVAYVQNLLLFNSRNIECSDKLADHIRALITEPQASALAQVKAEARLGGIDLAREALRLAVRERAVENAYNFFEEYVAVALEAAAKEKGNG